MQHTSKVIINNCLQYLKVVLKPSDLWGLRFSFHSISASISCVSSLKSVPLGMYWRISPFVFSFAPRSQEWLGGRSRTRHRAPSQSPYGGRIPFRCQPLSYVSCPCRVAAPQLPCWPAGGFFPSKPADQHQMRAPIVCRHDGHASILQKPMLFYKVSRRQER